MGGVGEEGLDGLGEGGLIVFFDEEAAVVVGDGFGDAAVVGGDDGAAAGHGFEHGVGNAFAIAVGAGATGVEEEVGALDELAEGLLLKEAGEVDGVGDVEGLGELLEFGKEGAFTGDGEGGFRVGLFDLREGVEGEVEAFFGDESAGLDELPGSVIGRGAGFEVPFVQGDAGALDVDFFGRTAEGDEVVGEAVGARLDLGGEAEDFAHGGEAGGFVGVDAGVGTVVGDDDGFRKGFY